MGDAPLRAGRRWTIFAAVAATFGLVMWAFGPRLPEGRPVETPWNRPGDPGFVHDEPEVAYRKVLAGETRMVVLDLTGREALALSRDRQARIIRVLYTPAAWHDLPISATEPGLWLRVLPDRSDYGMDRRYVYPESRLSPGIAIAEHQDLQYVLDHAMPAAESTAR